MSKCTEGLFVCLLDARTGSSGWLQLTMYMKMPLVFFFFFKSFCLCLTNLGVVGVWYHIRFYVKMEIDPKPFGMIASTVKCSKIDGNKLVLGTEERHVEIGTWKMQHSLD